MIKLMEKLLDALAKYGFGFSIGSGLTGFLLFAAKILFPDSLPSVTEIFPLAIFGGALGLGLSKFISKSLAPFNKSISFYGNLVELYTLKNMKIITAKDYKRLRKGLISKYYQLDSVTLPLSDGLTSAPGGNDSFEDAIKLDDLINDKVKEAMKEKNLPDKLNK